MKKITLTLSLILGYYGLITAQTCKTNMLTNPSFNSGLSGGWSNFSGVAVPLTSSKSGCVDTFILLGTGGSFKGGIQQNVSFTSTKCYDMCICLASQNKCRVRVFAATTNAGVTDSSLATNSYPSGSAQLIDSIDINGTGNTFCKQNWTASANFTRLIILNTLQPTESGAELWVDNVCLSLCATSSLKNNKIAEGLKIITGSEKLTVTFNNENFDCQIIEITGKTVRSFSNVNEFELDNNSFNHGVYILRVVKDGMTYSQRVAF